MPTSQAAGPGSLGILWSTRLLRNSSGTERSSIFLLPRSWMHVEVAPTVLNSLNGMEAEMFLLEMHAHILAGTSLPLVNPPAPAQCQAFWFSTCFLPFLHEYQSFPWCRMVQEWMQGMTDTRVCVCRAVNNAICMKCSIWVCNKAI